VTFGSAGSSDPDGSIVSYNWSFGDGGTGTGTAPAHVYQSAGMYMAVLTVTDNQGSTDTDSVVITASTNPNTINAPTNLTGVGGKGKATLNWRDNSGNESGFYIERAPFGTSNFAQVGQVDANVATFQQSAPRGKYVYRVRAFNGTGVSAYSNSVTVQVK
jgi:thermitase